MLLHEQLLDAAAANSSQWAEQLRGRSILVTGASGFLASSLLAFLARMDRTYGLGLDLHASARRSPDEIGLFRFLRMAPPGRWKRASVEETEAPDVQGLVVVHAASYGSPKDYQREPLATFRSNTQGLLNLYEAAARRRAAQFVYISSAEIYGQPPDSQIPTGEYYVGGLPTLSSRSIYGESKRMAEVLGACLSEQTRIPFTVVRPWNVYGPGQRLGDGRVPIEFIRQAREIGRISLVSDGSPRRSFCHAWVGARQIAGLLCGDAAAGPWNIGCDKQEITMLDLARKCAAAYGLPESAVSFNPSARAPGMQRSAPNVEKIDQMLGTTPFVPLDQGLETLREWFEFLETR